MIHNLYHQKLHDHYHNSPYRGAVAQADFSSQTHNPSCGDKITISGTIKENRIDQLRFEGVGCIISQAAASLLCELATGKTVEQSMQLNDEDLKQMVGENNGASSRK